MPSARAVRGSSQRDGSKRALPTVIVPPSGLPRPDSTSSTSLCPLPDTPATPTISPACRSSENSRSRTTPSLSRKPSPRACTSTAPRCTAVSACRPIATLRPTIASASDSTLASAISQSCTTCPARITVTRSHSRITSLSLCVIRMIVVPAARSRPSTSNSCSVSCGVSTAVGSSRISTRAPRYSAFRISSRCWSPTGRSPTRASRFTFSPVLCISVRSRSRTWPSALCSSACGSAPSITLSSALSVSTSMKCWWTMPMPRAMASWALRIVAGWPKTSIAPASAV